MRIEFSKFIYRHSEDTELLVDSLIGRSSVEQFESNTICRFCALENVEMIATACVPHSSIAQLFEYVTNIKVSSNEGKGWVNSGLALFLYKIRKLLTAKPIDYLEVAEKTDCKI